MRMRNKPWVKPELEACEYFYEFSPENKGHWNDKFHKKQPIHLELGCGKGVFIAKQAFKNPDINYIGIDMKSVVLASAVRNIKAQFQETTPQNVVLTPYDIERILNVMDKNDIVQRIYINFCNPWPTLKQHKKRLTYPRQLELYKTLFDKSGEIYFKTDDDDLFEDSIGYFNQSGFEIKYITRDLYNSDYVGNVDTEHEQKFVQMGIPIKFLIATIDNLK